MLNFCFELFDEKMCKIRYKYVRYEFRKSIERTDMRFNLRILQVVICNIFRVMEFLRNKSEMLRI